eukprot:TRINITY_DN41453_c0_g1_i1.p1 TRINITY_DN41453_c0_g1~~TRINITY_DN41453_c0_g1_i1.p1  ORF type:complete len:810 (-),score=184.70 TRINITY_DN41453_c0_g1_i1:24-2453(-)
MSNLTALDVLAKNPKRRVEWVLKKLKEELAITHRDLLYEVLTRRDGRAFASEVTGRDAMRTYNAVLAAIDLFTNKQKKHLQMDNFILRKLHADEQEKTEKEKEDARAEAKPAAPEAKPAAPVSIAKKAQPAMDLSSKVPELIGTSAKAAAALVQKCPEHLQPQEKSQPSNLSARLSERPREQPHVRELQEKQGSCSPLLVHSTNVSAKPESSESPPAWVPRTPPDSQETKSPLMRPQPKTGQWVTTHHEERPSGQPTFRAKANSGERKSPMQSSPGLQHLGGGGGSTERRRRRKRRPSRSGSPSTGGTRPKPRISLKSPSPRRKVASDKDKELRALRAQEAEDKVAEEKEIQRLKESLAAKKAREEEEALQAKEVATQKAKEAKLLEAKEAETRVAKGEGVVKLEELEVEKAREPDAFGAKEAQAQRAKEADDLRAREEEASRPNEAETKQGSEPDALRLKEAKENEAPYIADKLADIPTVFEIWRAPSKPPLGQNMPSASRRPPVLSSGVSSAHPEQVTVLDVEPPLPLWRYVAPERQETLQLRAEPAVDCQLSGSTLQPGEVFRVSEELPGKSGVLFLRLADGRGWAFDRMSGLSRKRRVRPLCVPHQVSVAEEGEEEGEKNTVGDAVYGNTPKTASIRSKSVPLRGLSGQLLGCTLSRRLPETKTKRRKIDLHAVAATSVIEVVSDDDGVEVAHRDSWAELLESRKKEMLRLQLAAKQRELKALRGKLDHLSGNEPRQPPPPPPPPPRRAVAAAQPIASFSAVSDHHGHLSDKRQQLQAMLESRRRALHTSPQAPNGQERRIFLRE